MHPLNFYDDGDERKKNFHSWKEKEGILLQHFHALNLIILSFSLLISLALRATDRQFLPLCRRFCRNLAPPDNEPLHMLFFSFDVYAPPQHKKTLVSLRLFEACFLLAYKYAIQIDKDLLRYHLIQDFLLIDVLKNYMHKL